MARTAEDIDCDEASLKEEKPIHDDFNFGHRYRSANLAADALGRLRGDGTAMAEDGDIVVESSQLALAPTSFRLILKSDRICKSQNVHEDVPGDEKSIFLT